MKFGFAQLIPTSSWSHRFPIMGVCSAMAMMVMMMMMMMLTAMTMTVEGAVLKTLRSSRTKRSEPSEAEWSEWFNSDSPWDGEGDFETTDNIQKTQQICPWDQDVVGAQCRVSGTNDSFDSSTTAFLQDHLLQACSRHGLICLNSHQASGRCHDYQVRFLCQASEVDGGSDSLFPNLDFRIYILLAAVPLAVIVLRLLWMCCCKAHLKRQRQRRDQERRQQQHRDSLTSGTLSTSSSQASFDSALANPPPAYTELFGDGQPAVFAISGGECASCGKCLQPPCFVDARGGGVGASAPPPAEGEREEGEGGEEGVPSPVSPGADDVFVAAPPSSGTESSQTPADSTAPVLRPSLPSSSSLQGAVAPPLPSPPPRGTHGRCTCSCHRVPAEHVNLAFQWDVSDPVRRPSGPALLPGMHKPVFNFPRIGSTTSFTSYTSLPDYDEALEILKKSGLFLDEEKV